MGIPFIERVRYYKEFMHWASTELQRNIKATFRYILVDARRNGGIERNWQSVLGDFAPVITAGSDPMRQAYYLFRSPQHLAKLHREPASINI
ncbi:hypothetical protein BDW68DRAFT_172820 [Aspergillus falconensis]